MVDYNRENDIDSVNSFSRDCEEKSVNKILL